MVDDTNESPSVQTPEVPVETPKETEAPVEEPKEAAGGEQPKSKVYKQEEVSKIQSSYDKKIADLERNLRLRDDQDKQAHYAQQQQAAWSQTEQQTRARHQQELQSWQQGGYDVSALQRVHNMELQVIRQGAQQAMYNAQTDQQAKIAAAILVKDRHGLADADMTELMKTSSPAEMVEKAALIAEKKKVETDRAKLEEERKQPQEFPSPVSGGSVNWHNIPTMEKIKRGMSEKPKKR